MPHSNGRGSPLFGFLESERLGTAGHAGVKDGGSVLSVHNEQPADGSIQQLIRQQSSWSRATDGVADSCAAASEQMDGVPYPEVAADGALVSSQAERFSEMLEPRIVAPPARGRLGAPARGRLGAPPAKISSLLPQYSVYSPDAQQPTDLSHSTGELSSFNADLHGSFALAPLEMSCSDQASQPPLPELHSSPPAASDVPSSVQQLTNSHTNGQSSTDGLTDSQNQMDHLFELFTMQQRPLQSFADSQADSHTAGGFNTPDPNLLAPLEGSVTPLEGSVTPLEGSVAAAVLQLSGAREKEEKEFNLTFA